MTEKPSTSKKTQRMTSPEQLDAALSIVSSQSWVWLGTIGVLLLAFVIWAFVAKLTYRADGLGIILKENSVLFDVTAPYQGIVESVQVKVGDIVKEGDRLAEVRFPEKETELTATRRLLSQTQTQLDTQTTFVATDLPRRKADKDKKILSLEKSLKADEQLLSFLTALAKTQKAELKAGYITRQQQEGTLNQLHSAEQSIRTTKNEIRSLNTSYSEQVNAQKQKTQQLQQQLTQTKGKQEQLIVTLQQGAYIISPAPGTVTEIDVNPGQRIPNGAQIAVVEQAGEGLHTVAYFKNSEGKKLAPGMIANVAPMSVKKNIYGTIEATVIKVSPLPETEDAIKRVLGNAALAKQLTQGGAPIAATLLLKSDPKSFSGLRWTSSTGPPQKVTPGTSTSVEVIVNRIRPIDLVVPLYETWIATEGRGAPAPPAPAKKKTPEVKISPESQSPTAKSAQPETKTTTKTLPPVVNARPAPSPADASTSPPKARPALNSEDTASYQSRIQKQKGPSPARTAQPGTNDVENKTPTLLATSDLSSDRDDITSLSATHLKDIDTMILEEGVIVHLKANGLLPDPKQFRMKNPHRLVIDFKGIQNDLPFSQLPIESPSLKKIRIGEHDTKVRIVFDRPNTAGAFETPRLVSSAEGLFIVIGDDPKLDRALIELILPKNDSSPEPTKRNESPINTSHVGRSLEGLVCHFLFATSPHETIRRQVLHRSLPLRNPSTDHTQISHAA